MASRNETIRVRIPPEWFEKILTICNQSGLYYRPGMTGGPSLWVLKLIGRELGFPVVDQHERLAEELTGKKFKRVKKSE